MYTGYGPGALTHSGAGGQRKRLNVDLRGVLHAYVLVQEGGGGAIGGLIERRGSAGRS